ncbi:Uncharacterized mitochondrial protein AtMg01410 [Striga hermonthica]|uniref:Uncharacterized mitochondrial protein AtMg01410 n=1 Tax=Striga hermonthica TaxID=68872 RepID=A0A9N7R7X7_STRHE|nr:Uncharacterized mitochondrial protein AtMg01410 [Striga hermonthica]
MMMISRHRGQTICRHWDLDWFEAGPYLPSCEDLGIPPVTGRLGCSLEGAGKRRIFAIGNYVNQRLLNPVHVWLASVLKSLPMDGTYDQTRPLYRLRGAKDAYSYDLTAATGPLVIMFEVFQYLFDRSFFASSIVNSCLATILVPFVKRKWSQVSFVAGQPLGYLSSWPLFAFSHHGLVGSREGIPRSPSALSIGRTQTPTAGRSLTIAGPFGLRPAQLERQTDRHKSYLIYSCYIHHPGHYTLASRNRRGKDRCFPTNGGFETLPPLVSGVLSPRVDYNLASALRFHTFPTPYGSSRLTHRAHAAGFHGCVRTANNGAYD